MFSTGLQAQSFDFSCIEYPSIINENFHYYIVSKNHQFSHVDVVKYTFQACPGLIAYPSAISLGNVDYISHKIIWQWKYGPINPLQSWKEPKWITDNSSDSCELPNESFLKKYSYYMRFILEVKYMSMNGVNYHSVYSEPVLLPVINN